MARQDINVDATNGELNTTNNLTNKAIYNFHLLDKVDGENNDDYCYAEIIVPPNFEQRYKDENGIHVKIPYVSEYKELKVCIRLESDSDYPEYMINKTDNKIWYPVFIEMDNGNNRGIKLSEYRTINEECNFNLILRAGYLSLFSGHETDLIIKASMNQNEVFLLKSFASCLYQHPTTGVGLINFLHGNFENTGLAQKLQSEFNADNMIINDAYMNSFTGELYLDIIEKNG